MVSGKPKTPKREFKIRYKGKTATLFAVSHSTGESELWGGQIMCLWGCPRKFEIAGKISPKRVAVMLESALKAHWNVIHKNQK